MDTNDKIKTNSIDYISNVKDRLNETYGIKSFEKEVK